MTGEGKHILVCDDDAITLRTVREILQNRMKAHLETTTDPQYAFELVLKKQYDLLIFDLVMPRIEGDLLYSLILEVYKNLLPAEHRIPPVILISGDAHQKRAQEFRLMPGVRALIPKPFTMQRLVEEVEKVFVAR